MLVGVRLAKNDEHILLASKNGQAVRFAVDSMRIIKSRSSSGVIGMDLDKKDKDKVVSITIVGGAERDTATRDEYLNIPLELRILVTSLDNKELEQKLSELEKKINLDVAIIRKWAESEQFLLTITENGYGKRTSTHEYRISGRGGKGVINILTTERNGKVIASFVAGRFATRSAVNGVAGTLVPITAAESSDGQKQTTSNHRQGNFISKETLA